MGELLPIRETIPATVDATPMQLMQTALERNCDIEVMERLAALAEKFEAAKAKQDFNRAMAEFQADCPDIPKTKTVEYPTKNGGTMRYAYAPLEGIAKTIRPVLHRLGSLTRMIRK